MTTQEILLEFGFDRAQLKAAERALVRGDSTLKKKYAIRLFSLMAGFIVTRLISVQFLPEMPWVLHFVVGLLAVIVLSWLMTREVTNPALAAAIRRSVEGPGEEGSGEQVSG